MSNSSDVKQELIGGVKLWEGDSEVATIAANIAALSMVSTCTAYMFAGLLLAYRYNRHSRLKLKEKEARSSQPGRGVASLENATVVAVSAGANIYIFWMTVLIPVVWMLIGAMSSFLVGFSLGALLAGIFIFGNVPVTLDLQIAFGVFVSVMQLFFQGAPASIQLIFL